MTSSTQSPLASDNPLAMPDTEVSVRETFGIDTTAC